MSEFADIILKLLRSSRRGNRKLASQFDIEIDRVTMDDRSYIIDIANKDVTKAFVVGYILGRAELSKMITDNYNAPEYPEVPEDCSSIISKLVEHELKKAKR